VTSICLLALQVQVPVTWTYIRDTCQFICLPFVVCGRCHLKICNESRRLPVDMVCDCIILSLFLNDSTLSNWFNSLQLAQSNAPMMFYQESNITDSVMPCKYLTSCDRTDTHTYAHTRINPITQSRQNIRLTQPLKAVPLKSDYRWGSPQFPEHCIHHKWFSLENIHLFLSVSFLTDRHTLIQVHTHMHIYLKGKVINRESDGWGKIEGN